MKRDANIIECPRDAMQGIHDFIPTEKKIKYIQSLLSCGFDVLDCGSFVSPKSIPQMADTQVVINNLNLEKTNTELLVIVANERGMIEAAHNEKITYLGFPLSISETFQKKNTNISIRDALVLVDKLSEICSINKKKPVIYISMAFGNPYGDLWNAEIAIQITELLHQKGIQIISLADTVGIAKPKDVFYIFSHLIPSYPDIVFGAHLHSRPETWRTKLEAAIEAGCFRFDGALKGYGGCPMAGDTLTGNMPTENILQLLNKMEIGTSIRNNRFMQAMTEAQQLFSDYV